MHVKICIFADGVRALPPSLKFDETYFPIGLARTGSSYTDPVSQCNVHHYFKHQIKVWKNAKLLPDEIDSDLWAKVYPIQVIAPPIGGNVRLLTWGLA